MSCRLCTKLEEAVLSAREPDLPNVLLGLTEAGKRNRSLQRQERLLCSELNLEKHKKWCKKREENSLAEN
jgi:hypothetical protein